MAGAFPWSVLAAGWGLCLLISALGFLRTDWFISIGYGLSISGLATFFGIIWRETLPGAAWLPLLLLFLYGLRLTGYLIARERAASFSRELQASKARSRHLGPAARLAIWFSVSGLYVAMASPVAFMLSDGHGGAGALPGILVMAAGLGLEMVADYQKSAAKRRAPDDFVRHGVFTLSRSPNYFGEMMFWLGHFLAAVSAYHHLMAWLLAGLGLVCIQLIMLGSARRLEQKQQARYGNSAAWRSYARQVPVLIPFIPLYSLERLKIWLG